MLSVLMRSCKVGVGGVDDVSRKLQGNPHPIPQALAPPTAMTLNHEPEHGIDETPTPHPPNPQHHGSESGEWPQAGDCWNACGPADIDIAGRR